MKLNDLLKNVMVEKIIGNIENIEVLFLCDNTKEVKIGCLFVAIKGLRVDSHQFLQEVIQNGVVAVVVEKEQENLPVPQIVVSNSRLILSQLCHNFYKNVLEKIKIIGVVGTNGKTTTSYLIRDILKVANIPVGVIGTNGVEINEEKIETNLTTPDTLQLFEVLQKMMLAGVQVVVIELSAHAIFLHKASGFQSTVAVFTNFSPEHLDFFKTIKEYKKVKLSYFQQEFCKQALINADDPVGKELLQTRLIPSCSYGLQKRYDVYATNIQLQESSTTFLLHFGKETQKINLNLIGTYNIYNSLAAASVCRNLGVSMREIAMGLNTPHFILGRFNFLKVDKNCTVILDFAHTEKAMEEILKNIRATSNAQLICVFGCPGSRDHYKRKKMGMIAGKYCDKVLVTSDNPDIENPNIIFRQIERGLKKTHCNYEIIEDRKEAIKQAFALKKQYKTCKIVVLGKGTEPHQIINGIFVPYNDEEEILKYIKK